MFKKARKLIDSLAEGFLDYIHHNSLVRLQIIMQIFTLFAFLIICYKPLQINYFVFFDDKPMMHHYTPQNESVLANTVNDVFVTLMIKDFPQFDVVKNQFTMDATIRFEFNASRVPLKIIEDFSFNRGTIISRSNALTKMVGTSMIASYDILVRFSPGLDYRYFPFNNHRINLVLINNVVRTSELIYRVEESRMVMSANIFTQGWANIGIHGETGFIRAETSQLSDHTDIEHPAILFSFDYANTGFKNVFLIVLPMMMMFFLALFSISLSPETQSSLIVSLAVGAVSSLLVYRFVIQNLVPYVEYFTISDFIYLYFLTSAFMCLMYGMFMVSKGEISFLIKALRVFLIIALHIGFNIMLLILLYVRTT